MELSAILDRWGDGTVLAVAGLAIGLAFGAFAEHSSFCLRASVVEIASRRPGPRLVVWLLGFATAVTATQAAIWLGLLDVSDARELAMRGSTSGAIIGGAMFGAGMILARGCASRILILSATGNLRSLVTGLILTIVAQASLRGVLSPVREGLAGLWTVEGGSARNLLSLLRMGPGAGVAIGLAVLALALWLWRRNPVARGESLAAVGVGLAVMCGWLVTSTLAGMTFDGGKVSSVTFIGPSADTLMGLINARAIPLTFDLGLIPGVFLGSFAATMATGRFRWQSFEGGASMLRYITGACLMGFGGMLAGGCAVGAGVSGSAIFAVTGWIALGSMVTAGALAHLLTDAEQGLGSWPALRRA